MQSLTELYKIGRGPSSSHTIGPSKAAVMFLTRNPDADYFKVTLYGSLAKTGKGHRTDYAIQQSFAPIPCTVHFDLSTQPLPHPNTMELSAYKNNVQQDYWRVFSIGGGTIRIDGSPITPIPDCYPHSSFADISAFCVAHHFRIWEYVQYMEGPQIWEKLSHIWKAMKDAINQGLLQTGPLPGGLNIPRKARYLYQQSPPSELAEAHENRLVCAYAFAASEQNAAGGVVVTAPTCGASGVLPAVLFYQQVKKGYADDAVLKALATGGIIGNLIKTNASISGAECGCQAEIGSACSMAAAALGELFDLSLEQIEYAAEVAMEHHLGLTCDPIAGLVQIPCIERNAVAAMRAINAVNLATFLSGTRKISFDLVVQTMYETGKDLSGIYRETSEGGLAKLYQ